MCIPLSECWLAAQEAQLLLQTTNPEGQIAGGQDQQEDAGRQTDNWPLAAGEDFSSGRCLKMYRQMAVHHWFNSISLPWSFKWHLSGWKIFNFGWNNYWSWCHISTSQQVAAGTSTCSRTVVIYFCLCVVSTHSKMKSFSSWYSVWPSSGTGSVRRIFGVSKLVSTHTHMRTQVVPVSLCLNNTKFPAPSVTVIGGGRGPTWECVSAEGRFCCEAGGGVSEQVRKWWRDVGERRFPPLQDLWKLILPERPEWSVWVWRSSDWICLRVQRLIYCVDAAPWWLSG